MRIVPALAVWTLIMCVGGVACGQPPQGEGRFRGAGPDGPRPPAPPVMAALDTDGDGELSEEEIEKASASLRSLDKDGNGRLTPDEMRPERGGRGPGQDRERARPGRPDGDRAERPGQRRREGREDRGSRDGRPDGPANAQMFVERIMQFDEDGDGKVSIDEMPERMTRMLDRADENGDDAIDEEELKAVFEFIRERRGGGGGRGPGEGGGERRRPNRPQRPDDN